MNYKIDKSFIGIKKKILTKNSNVLLGNDYVKPYKYYYVEALPEELRNKTIISASADDVFGNPLPCQIRNENISVTSYEPRDFYIIITYY